LPELDLRWSMYHGFRIELYAVFTSLIYEFLPNGGII
jgi:hypothetical protein